MVRLAITATAALAIGACGIDGGGPAADIRDGLPASIKLDLSSDADFAGHSVEVCGRRALPAEAEYPCADELRCTCLAFTAAGLSGPSGEPGAFGGLCPSTNRPVATWQFDYTIFGDSLCSEGAQLTGLGASTLVCYETDDLARRANPNRVIEELLPGGNDSRIVCIVAGAASVTSVDDTSATTVTTPPTE